MNEVSEQVLQAIDIIAQQRISELQFDKTIQAKIYRIQNIDTGEYKVRYNGNIFSAYCDDPKKTYKVDELVYVNVPEGNFSNRKLIVSSVSASSLSYAQLTQLQNTVVSVSPSLTTMYGGVKEEPYQVIAGAAPSGSHYEDWIFQGAETYNSSDFHGLFQQYASQYQTLRIQASFLTQFHCLHNQGNYGIEVVFYTTDGKTLSYRLDLNAFNGDPYGFSVYAPQMILLKLPKDYLLGLKSIRFFQEEFIPDRFIENGVITTNQNLTTPNIFAKDLVIDFVEVQDLTDTAYYLTIDAPQGTLFSDKVSSLDLVGQLIYKGENIMNPSTCQCTWYERDPSIMVGVKGYDKIVGVGWKPVAGGESYLLTLSSSQVVISQEYKLKVIYNKETTLFASIIIKNTKPGLSPKIEQVTEENEIYLRLVDTNDSTKNFQYTGDWYMQYPDGGYLVVPNGEDKNSIPVSQYMTYDYITFYCAVKLNGTTYCGTLSYVLRNSESEDDVDVAYIGEDLYHYDANGDVTVEDAERDRTLQVTLNWKDGQAASYTATWAFKESNGQEVDIPTNLPYYNPSNSMMEDLWVDNLNILHYNIKQKYKVTYNNNTLVLRVRTLFGDVFRFEKEILFVKDGDQGTNGTSYVIAVRPCDNNGVKLNTYNPIIMENGVCTNIINFRCYVYHDGELINGNDDYKITYSWQGIGVYVNSQEHFVSDNGVDTVMVTGRRPQDYYNYLKVEARIQDKTNKVIYVHSNYPIDTSVDFEWEKADISEIPSYIKYRASGVSPSFSSKNLIYRYDNELHNELIASESPVLEVRNDADNNYILRPPVSFTFDGKELEDNLGLLSFTAPASANDSGTLYHPVLLFLDTFGNEQINNWDGTKLEIGKDDEGNEISLFAPQIGAGQKESDNSFTGVVMGKDSAQDKIGLYGYQAGINTFGLMEDGKAYFGALKGGGRITIDGKTAEIYGGGGGDSEVGMTITLADLSPENKTDAIKIGGGAFNVFYDGSLVASTGRIGAKKVSNGRYEGGWTLDENQLSGGKGSDGNFIALNSDPDNEYAIWAGESRPENAPFWIKKDGSVNINITGVNEATKEYVETQFQILDGKISSSITDAEDRMGSRIEQTLDSLTLEVTNGLNGASIVLKAAGQELGSGFVQVTGNIDVSGELSADALYAIRGDIADLTVDKLSTSRRIIKYLAKDQSDDNYIRIQDQFIELVAGTTKGEEVEAVNPLGQKMYWAEDISGSGITIGEDGYPHHASDNTRVFITTNPNSWPVKVYKYKELVKRSIGFEKIADPDLGTVYSPIDRFGAGNEAGDKQATIVKSGQGFEIRYDSSTKGDIGMIANDTGYLDLYGLRKTTGLDFSKWDSGSFTETVDGLEDIFGYKVEFDGQNRPIKITDRDDHVTVITW